MRKLFQGALAAACAACLLSAAVSLGGCKRMEPVEIAGEQQAWDYLGAELSQKYGEEFEFVDTVKVYQVGKVDARADAMSYTGLFAPASDPSKPFAAGVYARDGKTIEAPRDDYHQYLFKRPAEELCASRLRGRPDLAGWAVVLKGRFDDRAWKGATLSQYLGDYGFFDPYDYVYLILPKDLPPEEQGRIVHACLEDLSQAGCGFSLRVGVEGKDVLKADVYGDTRAYKGRNPSIPSQEDIAKSIETTEYFNSQDPRKKDLRWDGNGPPDGKPEDPSDVVAYPTITWNPGHGPGVSFDAPPASE